MLSIIRKREILPVEVGNSSISFFNLYYKQDRSFLPYFTVSFITIIFLLISLSFCRDLLVNKEQKLSQLIDIEFLSQTDFKNIKNLLPATVPKPSLSKRSSPRKMAKGQLFADPVFIIKAAKGNASNEQYMEKEIEVNKTTDKKSISKLSPLTDFSNRYLPLSVPFNKIPQSVANLSSKKQLDSQTSIDMEEVKPPELLEVKENEGDENNYYWQDGGKSINGTGLSSSLADYLKDLHKKLKQAWAPPSGNVHHIKVIFRLNQNGHLLSMQLVQSCGDKNADESALLAIKEAAPFGKLPREYTHHFLDLAYTFNYTTDELTELNKGKENLEAND